MTDFSTITNDCRNDDKITVLYAGNVTNGKKLSIETKDVPQWLWTWMAAEGGIPLKARSSRPITLTIQIHEL